MIVLNASPRVSIDGVNNATRTRTLVHFNYDPFMIAEQMWLVCELCARPTNARNLMIITHAAYRAYHNIASLNVQMIKRLNMTTKRPTAECHY